MKLHNPIYNSYRKRVYFATLVFLNIHNDYLPLEYITPLEYARKLLGNVEKMLIQYFKPELNVQNIDSDINVKPINLHIQNFTDTSPFLNDIFV